MPRISRAEAAVYIGDMAASLKRIAAGCDLAALAGLLAAVESEARAAEKNVPPHHRRKG